jgi:hypothetical protein
MIGWISRKKRPAFAAAVAASCILLASAVLGGCDWIHYNFMNSIPFRGNPQHNPDVYVYLGVDGLSYHTVQDAMKKGAFSGPDWHLAKFITMFPGTSDASWTRIMHTPKIGGYEIEYYDPDQDKVVNPGIVGLAKHVTPAFFDFINFEFDYLKAFDYRANGYTHSLNAYSDTYISLAETLDNLFFTLDGRVQTAAAFSAYLLEFDVLGHMRNSDEVSRSFMMLAERIQKFRDHHPERRIHFTILSDHGMDFIRVKDDRFVDFTDELAAAGIDSVETLAGREDSPRPVAIPIKHTRVTYIALHTLPQMVDDVAGRITQRPSVDLAVTRLKAPLKDPHAPGALEWYGIWSEGKMSVYFGFDAQTDEYYLPAGQDYARLDLTLAFDPGQEFKTMKDDDLFAASKHKKYPDIFYRTRTALTSVSVKYPADVMISFRPTYASLGFSLGGKDIASAGFHGAMEELGTLGTLLTNEKEIPDAVRADTFLELFPRMKEHMKSLGVEMIEGDRNASLHY